MEQDRYKKNYKDVIRDTKLFNEQLRSEREQRLPFIDSHTGIAQRDCHLWRCQWERRYVHQPGRVTSLYSYPAQRWQKRRREYLLKYPTHLTSEGASQSTSPYLSPRRLTSATNTDSSTPIESAQRACNHSTLFNGTYSSKTSASLFSHAPPRADSTGSHSCVDSSDSRDQSSATSQSYDSPRGICLDEEPMCNNLAGHFTPAVRGNSDCSLPNSCELNKNKSNDHTSHGAQLNNHCHSQDVVQSQVANEHTKANKKKNAGQSLIKINNGLGSEKLGLNINYAIRDDDETTREKPSSPARSSSQTTSLKDKSRPFVCSLCDHTYRTRSGLSYHYIHVHDTTLPRKSPIKQPGNSDAAVRPKEIIQAKSKVTESVNISVNQFRTLRSHKAPEESPSCLEVSEYKPAEPLEPELENSLNDTNGEHKSLGNETEKSIETKITSPDKAIPDQDTIQSAPDQILKANLDQRCSMKDRPRLKQNPFCDFCHGTIDRNRRTRLPEELISCSSCGSSGHPSCLRFSENIRLSVKKYDWQCIECKTCSKCNKADDEERLLFCDDCDRSYHTYCLKPPLEEPPEGNWSCDSCLVEYHSNSLNVLQLEMKN